MASPRYAPTRYTRRTCCHLVLKGLRVRCASLVATRYIQACKTWLQNGTASNPQRAGLHTGVDTPAAEHDQKHVAAHHRPVTSAFQQTVSSSPTSCCTGFFATVYLVGEGDGLLPSGSEEISRRTNDPGAPTISPTMSCSISDKSRLQPTHVLTTSQSHMQAQRSIARHCTAVP
jgi:hypothetical protein